MNTQPKHIELIFPANAHPGDLEIIAAATYDEPGRLRLGAARLEEVSAKGCRVYSANGGAFIGVIGYDEPWWPYETAYWLEDAPAGASEGTPIGESLPAEEVTR